MSASLFLPQAQAPVAPIGPAVPPTVVYEASWRQSIEYQGQPRLAVGATSVFVADDETGIAGYSTGDGRKTWFAELPSPVAPAVSDTLLFVASSGKLHALEQTTGQPRWTADLAASATELVWHSDRVITAAGTEIRTWLADGRASWRRDLGARPAAPIAVDAGVILVGLDDQNLVALRLADGSVHWTLRLDTRLRSVVASEGRLFCTGADGVLYALRRDGDPRPDWQFSLVEAIGKPAVDERRVYVALLDNTLRAFDLKRGNSRWREMLWSRPAAGPIVAGDHIVIPMLSGELMAVTAKDGSRAAGMAAPAQTATARSRLEAVAASPDGSSLYMVSLGEDGTSTLAAYRRTSG